MLKIVYEDKAASVELVTCDRRIWLDKDGQAVEDGDLGAKRLLCAPGRTIRRSEAEALGIELTAAPAKTEKKAKEARAKKAAKKAAEEAAGKKKAATKKTTKKKASKKRASKKGS